MSYRLIGKWISGMCTIFILAACGTGSNDSGPAITSSTGNQTNAVTRGIAVDPYIVGAVFQEVAPDGTILQRQSTPSGANGVFTFPRGLTLGSTIEMKAANKGVHGTGPFQGMLRRTVEPADVLSVRVTPLTTLIANGILPDDALLALANAGFTNLTASDLYADPMTGLVNRISGVTDQRLELLQAAMAVENYLEITGNFRPTLSDLNNPSHTAILNSMGEAVRSTLNSAEFARVSTALASDPQVTGPVAVDDLIMAVVEQQQTVVATAKNDMATTGSFNPAVVRQAVSNAMAQTSSMTKTMFLARQVQGGAADGATLYADNCASCHSILANSTKKNRSATLIQSAITNNVGSMGSLSGLTPAEVQAIADVLAGATPPPPTPSDGPTLYANNCAGCHGALASTGKPGRTAAQIQAAINNNVGGMGYLSTLTAAQVQAIANALPTPPPPNPGTPPDGVALYNSECAGCHGALASTSKPGRTAAQIQAAINNNVGGMAFLSTLTAAEVQAITAALPAAPPPPPVTDGPTLYANNCASCHGALASTTKPGRTAAQIQAPINNNIGGMGYLATLTAAQIQAIANALPAGPPAPTNCTSCHGQPPAGNTFPNVAGAHVVHTTLPSVNNNCATCHIGAGHDGIVNLGIAAAYGAKTGAATANPNNTCSSVRCHGGQTTPVWQTGAINVNTQCTSCHASGTSQYNGFSSGQHNRHVSRGYSCTVCHSPAKLAPGHFSNLSTTSFELDPAATIGGSGTSVGTYTPSASNATSGTCSSIACHGSQNW